MSNNIKLSPKHGVNPTMPVCFWCGQPKNEIALLGKLPDDAEAPKHIIMDYEPCDACREIFGKGIHVIGVTEKPMVPNMFPIISDEHNTLYPSGSMFVARPEWAERFLTANDQQDMVTDVLEKKALLLPDEIVNEIIKDAKAVEESEGGQDNADN